MKRRDIIGLVGALPLAAAVSGSQPARADNRRVTPGKVDPHSIEGLYTIHRKLQFSFDDQIVHWYLLVTRYGFVDNAFTPLWNLHAGFLSIAENLADGFQAKMMSATFYTDIKSGQLLENFDNPYTGERVRVPQPGLNRVVRVYNKAGLVSPLPRAMRAKRLGMTTKQYGDVGPAWVVGDDIWCRGDTGYRAEPTDKSGRVDQTNDWSTFHGSFSEVADSHVASANATQSFNDTHIWPDWLNMRDHPGNFVSRGFGRKAGSMKGMPPEWTAFMRDQFPRQFADPRGYILESKEG